MTLEDRIDHLESESAIRKLKARYLNACDRKDAETVRACFTADATIEFPPLGTFDVDGLIAIFTQMAVTTTIIDSHHGHNAEISIDGDTANAVWNLGFATVNPEDNSFRILSGFYTDEYVRKNGEWLISFTRSAPRKIIDGKLTDNHITASLLKETA